MNGNKTTTGTGDGKAWRDDYTDEDKTVLDNVYNNGRGEA